MHRDIKPNNILIEDQQPILADFGLARIADEAAASLAQPSSSPPTASFARLDCTAGAGTLPYMAPEQCTGAPVGEYTDVYAIGAVLYEMLTGRWLFDVPTARKFAECIVSRAPLPPSARRRSLPESVDAVVMQCLEKGPRRRFAGMEELWRALEGVYEEVTGTWLFTQVTNYGAPSPPFYDYPRSEWGADRD